MKSRFWKILLHKDSILLIGIFGSLWFTLNMLVDITTDFKKLHPHTGQVRDIYVVITRMKNKPSYKDTTRELRIALVDEPQYFTFSAKKTFDDITTIVGDGDTVTVCTKDKVFGIFGFGNEHTIAHLVKLPTEQVLVDFNEKQQYYNSFFWLPVLGTIGFLIRYIVRVRKRLWWELGGYRKHLDMCTTSGFASARGDQ